MDKELYKIHSEVCKVFSNPARLEILDVLRGSGKSVSELTRRTGLSQANVSQHLSVMKSTGIVSYRREGKNVYYALSNPKVVRAFDLMREALVENLAKRLKGKGG